MENNENEEVVPEGPTKPKRHMLFGHRFEGNVRRREDTNKTAIGRRVPKPTRRYLRRMMMRRTRSLEGEQILLVGYRQTKQVKIPYLGRKTIAIDVQLEIERNVQNETGKLATNSHERARAIAEDKECRRNARKDEMGESLRPLGVLPTRQELRANAKAKRKDLKKLIRQQQLHEKMFAAIGVSSSPSSSSTTDDSAPT